jgi:hypothetical protein
MFQALKQTLLSRDATASEISDWLGIPEENLGSREPKSAFQPINKTGSVAGAHHRGCQQSYWRSEARAQVDTA